MKLAKTWICVTVLTALVACQDDKNPEVSTSSSQTAAKAYEAYLQSAAKGHTYSDALSFHSKMRQSKMVSWLEEKSKQSNKPIEEFQKFFLSLTQQEAKCLSLEKLSDETNSENVILTYRGADTCTANSNARIEVIVKMVLDNGWKIQSEKVNISAR